MSSVFKIYSPEDCDFYYDGELQGHIEGNSDRAFRFEVERKGAYRLKFVNSEYKSELIVKVSIDADEEREVELDFTEVNDPVIKNREKEEKEETERRKREIAERKKQEEERQRRELSEIITAIECDYFGEHIPSEILSKITENGIVTIPKGVRKIGEWALDSCSSLISVIIPDSVTAIGVGAFCGCISITSIRIPDSVTAIGDGAFANCSSLTSIRIPDSVTAIGDGAFANCSSLTSIRIPDSVTAIGDSAFANCSSLTSIRIPDSVSAIRYNVFHSCSNLTSIRIPDSITEIDLYAFSNCSSLTSIRIPDSVTAIGDSAFANCSILKSIYCKATTPPKIDFYNNAFNNNAPDLKIYVPKSNSSTVLKAYKSAEGWKDYADSIEEYDFDNE